MQKITAPPLWDVEFLKDHEQAGLERIETAQFEQDWKPAETEVVRRVSNSSPLPALSRREVGAKRRVRGEALCVPQLLAIGSQGSKAVMRPARVFRRQ